MDQQGKVKVSIKTTKQTPSNTKPVVQRRGVAMDFTPVRRSTPRPVEKRVTDAERARHEAAKQQVARREEIHRQIEAQNEADIIARRRAEAARRELARKRATEEEAARARAEKEAKQAEVMRAEREKARRAERLEQEAAAERRKMVAIRRAEAAKRELARRQAAEADLKPATPRVPKIPVGSVDPIAREVSVKTDPSSRRLYGKIKQSIGFATAKLRDDSKEPVITRAEEEYRALHPEVLGDIDDFASEVAGLNDEPEEPEQLKKKDKSEKSEPKKLEAKKKTAQPAKSTSDKPSDEPDLLSDLAELTGEEDTSENNSAYVLGGRSPFFIGNNTNLVLHRPGYRLQAQVSEETFGTIPEMPSHEPSKPRAVERHSAPAEHSEPKPRTPERPIEHSKAPKEDTDAATRVSGSRYVPYEEPIPHKTLYARRVEAAKKEKTDIPTMVVADADKASGLTLAIVVALTVIVGAIVGFIAYLAFFQ